MWGRSNIYLAFTVLLRVRPSLSPGHTNDGIVLKYGDEFTTSVVPLHGDIHHTRPRVVRRIKWDKTCLSDCQKFTQKAKGMKCISAGRSRLQSEL